MPATISRHSYAAMFGPTTGDRVRLADTGLFIEVARDMTIHGEEVKFGRGTAGDPDTQPGVDIVIGPGTEASAAEDGIVTAGGFEAHIHFICPRQIEDAQRRFLF